ncbi:hypothetical protein EJ04DRAFT_360199 [Polyplosphaeria fusca]|uniref:C2H2-type domain-containing protein n=1 Tax=Polyplosphaeria fusca TaxID=682080 RepID=A0A9P4QT36_9PLEO|nr:hypothetical protein EJ04DRAFT_360199 [Polyplosphaeria fusca]
MNRAACTFCQKEFNGTYCRGNLQRHMREEHLQAQEKHCCRFCDHSSARKHNVRDHEKRKHGYP